MKRIFAIFTSLLLCFGALAANTDPNEIRITQNNPNIPSNGIVTRYLPVPAGNASYLFSFNGSTALPEGVLLGNCLSITSGTLDCDVSTPARAAISLTTTGTSGAATYNSTTGVLNVPNYAVPAARSFNYTTRSLNTCFQPSATRDAFVTYSVDIATTLSLTTGQQGTVYLEIFSDSACTTGTQEISRFVNGNTGTLTVGLALTQNVTGSLNGVIPAGAYVKLRTQNNTGTPTFTARPGQEVLQ